MPTTVAGFQDQYVCVLGLGYVGLTLAVSMADVGFKVLGLEIRPDVLRKLQKGEPHFYEPGLEENLRRIVAARRIKFSPHLSAQSKSTVFIITVGTPLDPEGRVRLDMIENVSREIASHLKESDMVIVRSTVKLGVTSRVIIPILNKAKVDYDLAFCPERTLEGQALHELRYLPQIVGGMNLRSTIRAAQLFQFLTPTVIRVSSLEVAEMIKLVDNSSRDVSFAYANEIAHLCDAMGINAIEVIKAGKLGYPRTNVSLPGPVGGPCLTKDSYILAESTAQAGFSPTLIMNARQLNESQPRRIGLFLKRIVTKMKGFSARPQIALLGLAFKGRPETDDLRGSLAKPVFQELKKHFPSATFKGFDAVVPSKNIRQFGLRVVRSPAEAFRGSHLVLLLNNHASLGCMNLESLSETMKSPGLIYDFWNMFSDRPLSLACGVHYLSLGNHFQSHSIC